MIYIIGPSHIHPDYTNIIQDEANLFKNCILDGYNGLPNWSSTIMNKLTEFSEKTDKIIWMVSDYKFNNFNYDELKTTNNLFLDTLGYPGNVSRDFMKDEHIAFLGDHTLKAIDHIIRHFPHIKLIFWCLYKRTKANSNSSYPQNLHYDSIKKLYVDNILDIDMYTDAEQFNTLIVDEGGHPNKEGYILLDKMIQSTFR